MNDYEHEIERLKAENEALRQALSRFVYEDRGKWRVGINGDADVTDIIGTLGPLIVATVVI